MYAIRNKQSPYTASDGYFWARYSSVNPRMALFVKVTPLAIFGGSSEAIGFTSSTRDMTLPGHAGMTFRAAPGISPTGVENQLDEPGNLEISGFFTAETISEAEILAGKWTFAEIEIFVACWDDTALGEWLVHKGYLGEMKTMQRFFTAESRGPLSLLSQEVKKITSRLCRVYEFGDDECGRALDVVGIEGTDYNMQHTLTVASVTDNYTIVFTKLSGTANNVPDDFFRSGRLTALGSTANGGVSREIRTSETESTTIVVTLKRRLPFTVTAGNQFLVIAGCDRTLDDCLKYENVINRRAEDFIPTIEALNRVTDA